MENEEVTLSNREKSKKARGRSFWCFGCDCYKVWAGQKCPKCGRISGKERDKPGE